MRTIYSNMINQTIFTIDDLKPSFMKQFMEYLGT